MDIYERLKVLCKKKGTTIQQMEIDNGMVKGHAYKWKKSVPTHENLSKLAEYFGVSTDYILTGKDPDEGYYADRETEKLAGELMNNKELKALFDVVKDMPKERLEAIYNLLKE